MSLWQGAKNAVDMMGATMLGLEIIGGFSRPTSVENSSTLRTSLNGVRTVVIALVEGYQGKITGAKLTSALQGLAKDLQAKDGIVTEAVLEAFRSAL